MDMTFQATGSTQIRGLKIYLSRLISFLLLRYDKDFRNVSEFRRKICWIIMRLLGGGPIVCPTVYGFGLLIDPTSDNVISKRILELGEYEAGTIHVVDALLTTGDVFIDIGAYIGLMSCIASRIVGQAGHVYTFEPLTSAYSLLCKNIEINKLTNVTKFKIALGSKVGKLPIYSGDHKNPASSSLLPKSNSRAKELVEVHTLDKILEKSNISTPTMIKIDVEGYELEVLKGMRSLLYSVDSPILIIEYSCLHPQYGGEVVEIFDLIDQINHYQIYLLNKGKSTPSSLVPIVDRDSLPNHDNIFCIPTTYKRRLKAVSILN